MAHLTRFGLSNFKAFKDQTDFKFKPITILTGTNSSGKSSLTKGIKLLKQCFTDDIEDLDLRKIGKIKFLGENAIHGSFNSIINKFTDKNHITI